MNKLARTYCIPQYSAPRPAGDVVQSSSRDLLAAPDRLRACTTPQDVTFTILSEVKYPVDTTGFFKNPMGSTGLLGLKQAKVLAWYYSRIEVHSRSV